jgi:hypothetical protein
VSQFLMGVDLGQAKDYTAICVVKRQDPRPWGYHVVWLERMPLGTTYPQVVERIKVLLKTEPLRGDAALVVDGTGVGKAVVDLMVTQGLTPLDVSIHGGEVVSVEGRHFRVPKRDLVAVLQVLLQSKRLLVAASLPEAGTLVKEMLDFKVKITEHANDTYSAWREGAHDDLVLAVAIACWFGERGLGVHSKHGVRVRWKGSGA